MALAPEFAGLGAAVDLGSGLLTATPLAPLAPLLQMLPSLFGGGSTPAGPQTSTTTSTNNQNPNQTGFFNNTLAVNQAGGSGGNASASGGFFGGGTAKGGAGGSNSAITTQTNNDSLTSNLPPALQAMMPPSMNLGGSPMSMMSPTPLPMVNTNSPFMNPSQPIAAGGVSPMMGGMMSVPQMQQVSGGQQITPGTASQAGGYDMPQLPMPQQSPIPGFNYPQRPPMQQGGVQQQAAPQSAPQGMSMQGRLAGAANPMVMGIMGDGEADGGDEGDDQPEGLQATAGSLNGASGKPLQAGTKGGQEAIDPVFNQATNRANAIGGQAKRAVSSAIVDHDNMKKIIKAGDKLKRDPIELGRTDASKKLKAANKDLDAILDPATHDAKEQEFDHQRYDRLSPGEKAAVDRINDGTSGQKPQSTLPPKVQTALKVLRVLGRMGEAGFGESGLLYAQQQGDYNQAQSQSLQGTAQQKADQHIYDKYKANVTNDMNHYISGLNNVRTAASASITDLNEQENNLNAETQNAFAQNKEDTYGTLERTLQGYGIDLRANDSSRTSYNEGLQNNARKISQSQRQQGLGIAQQNADKGTAAFNLANQKWDKEKTEKDLQITKLQNSLDANQWSGKFASLKPGTGIKLDQYQDALIERVKAGTLDGATAKEANRKAKIMLKAD